MLTPCKVINKRYCSKSCTNLAFRTRFKGENNPAFGKVYRSKETHPEWAASIREGTKGINQGELNGMKNSEVRQRMSKTRREKVTSNPIYRAERSSYMRQAWIDGKYNGVKVGKCKWYDHTRSDGSIVKLQGTWEVVLARHMDTLNIEYDAHVGRIPYLDQDNVERSYYPDFHVKVFDTYVDVKGAFFDEIQRFKMAYVQASNPNTRFLVANRNMLAQWGIDVYQQALKVRSLMTTLEIVETSGYTRDGTVIIDKKGGVWYTIDLPWWNPITWFRAITLPGRRSSLVLKTKSGIVRVKAIRLSATHVKMGQ